MAKQHLKWVFIGLNIIYIIFGLVIFSQAIVMDLYLQGKDFYDQVAWTQAPYWPMAFGIFSVAGLGFHGALTGKKWSLISFITANVIGVLTMLTLGAICARLTRLGSPGFMVYAAFSFVFAILEAIGIALAAMIMQPA